VTKPKTETKPAADPFAALAKPKPAAAKKSKIPVIESPGLSSEIKDWIEADEAVKNAEAKKAAVAVLILSHAEDKRLEASVATGECLSSVRLAAEGGTVTVTQKNQYCAVAAEALDDLRGHFGEDYARYFAEERSITVKKGADLAALAALVGQDRLAEFFDVATVAKVSQTFHIERSTNPKVQKKAVAVLGSQVRPVAPSIVRYTKED
jgi:hypothetical protein